MSTISLEPKVFIYGLFDPETWTLGYIGCTKNLKGRLASHVCDKRKLPRNIWFKSVLNKGLKPVMHVFEEVESCFKKEAEKMWLDFFISLGVDLNNLKGTPIQNAKMVGNKIGLGNKSMSGKRHSFESRLKMCKPRKWLKKRVILYKGKILRSGEAQLIYKLAWSQINHSTIARMFNVGPWVVSGIKHGKSWSYFTGHKIGVKS